MKKNLRFILLMLISFSLASCFLSCNKFNSNNFERFDELKDFLSQEVKAEKSGDFLVIVITGSCNSCEKETIKLMYDVEKGKQFTNYKKYVLLPFDRKDLYKQLKQKSLRVFYDGEMKLLSYGLNYHDNIIVVFTINDGVSYFSAIKSNNIEQVRHQLFSR